ncbi:hypothetical protein HDU97_005322 [Phlyctochytrium planicorne]|nr:hypothetical protein HDU97_005322 [Phlyctochytrium planicorne]
MRVLAKAFVSLLSAIPLGSTFPQNPYKFKASADPSSLATENPCIETLFSCGSPTEEGFGTIVQCLNGQNLLKVICNGDGRHACKLIGGAPFCIKGEDSESDTNHRNAIKVGRKHYELREFEPQNLERNYGLERRINIRTMDPGQFGFAAAAPHLVEVVRTTTRKTSSKKPTTTLKTTANAKKNEPQRATSTRKTTTSSSSKKSLTTLLSTSTRKSSSNVTYFTPRPTTTSKYSPPLPPPQQPPPTMVPSPIASPQPSLPVIPSPLGFSICGNHMDGQGISAGFIQFTSASGSILWVLQAYLAITSQQNPPILLYIPALQALQKIGNQGQWSGPGHTEGLAGFCEAWQQACATDATAFQQAQKKIQSDGYLTPNKPVVDRLGIKTALGVGQIMDTGIQLGYGAMLEISTNAGWTPNQGADEMDYMRRFLDARTQYLNQKGGAYPATKYRVDSYRYMLQKGNLNFEGGKVEALNNDGDPMTISCY